MSDLWTFSSPAPSLDHHPSSLSDFPVVISSPPPLSSPSPFKNHGNQPPTKVTSKHLLERQETSPHLPPSQAGCPHLPQATSPQLHPSQVTSPHVHHCQVMSPTMQPPQVTSPHLHYSQVPSPHPHVTSVHFPPPQVGSPQIPRSPHPKGASPQISHPHVTSPNPLPPQVTSPHLLHHQVTSPHPHVTSCHFPPPQVSSPQIPHSPHPHVASPQLPHSQISSPNPLPSQVTSPHLLHPQVNSPHHASPQFTNSQFFHQPHVSPNYNVPQSHAPLPYNLINSQVTSPHHAYPSPNFVPQPQITSPNLLSPPPNLLPSQNPNPGLDNPNWSRSEQPNEPSGFPNSFSYSYQIQTTAHLDYGVQSQNGFCADMTQKDIELEHAHRLPMLMDGGLYDQVDACGSVHDSWEPLEPTLSGLQCSPLGPMSGAAPMGRWNSVDFASPSADDFSNTHFFPDAYSDNNNTPQSFCSPTTPGQSPHYAQAISSLAPQMPPRTKGLGFPAQLNAAKTLSCCLDGSNSYPVTPDPTQHPPQETNSCLVPVKTEPIQDQRCFPAQGRGKDAGNSGQSPGVPAGLNWKVECGGRGRKGGARGGGAGQPDWAWIKRSEHESSAEAPGYRLQCTVCKRDFRSLPALNGHMRSHSGIRAATFLKKNEESSSPVQPSVSMVLPVSVPVQTRGATRPCRSVPKRSTRATSAGGGAALYHSLMHLKEQDEADKAAPANGDGRDGGAPSGGRSHYTPPPMLCPHRAGRGLYCSLTKRQQRVQTVQLNNAQNGVNKPVTIETLMTGIKKPQINVGQGFQAQIPALRETKSANTDAHKALLLWKPLDNIECPANQDRVEAFLTMARSSVMPGGGVSPEHALHVLLESRGDFLLTVEKLLTNPEASNNHTGWSVAERKQLVKSLQQHHKDFNSIQRDVPTKSLSQCVEFYYLWKKKLSLTVKIPAGLTITLPNSNSQRSSRSNSAS